MIAASQRIVLVFTSLLFCDVVMVCLLRVLCGVRCGLTIQAQRPDARDATIATATLPPGSLQHG